MCYNEGFDEISRLSGLQPQWQAKVKTILNLLGPQNVGCLFPTYVGLDYLKKILLRGVVTSSSDRATVRLFTPLHECEKVHKTRVSRLKIFVIIFRSVQVTADIPTGNRMRLYHAQFLSFSYLRPVIRNYCSEEHDFDICAFWGDFTQRRMVAY